MSSPLISLLAILVAGYLCRRYLWSTKSRSRLPFPPGPKPKPFIGNALDIPTKTPWLTYAKWSETYRSDILYVEALGNHIIILNSREAAADIMERRAAIYSDRPSIPMLELMGWSDSTPLLPHENLWRRHRRLFQQIFRKDAVVLYDLIERRKVSQMLRGLLETPDDLQAHIRTLAAAIIMAIMYGLNISTMNDKYVSIAERAVEVAAKAVLPGTSLVNTIPALRHIPPWFPGVKFHQVAAKRDGTGEPSVLRSLLEANDANGGSAEDESIYKTVSTASSVATFLCHGHQPRRTAKAQNEIDAVVGNDRLPGSEDRPSLPYVEAIYREVMRWRPVLPLGVPHTSLRTMFTRAISFQRGRSSFPTSESRQIQPERYFDSQGNLNNDDTILAFGFGRRYVSTAWLTIASVLATLNIAKAKDPQGNDIEIDGGYVDGAIMSVLQLYPSDSPPPIPVFHHPPVTEDPRVN
ncbi:cytochrome P450 [Infundibulicybe gibba]|nr:cytochrome P450 [Infundibulicybe gibba]